MMLEGFEASWMFDADSAVPLLVLVREAIVRSFLSPPPQRDTHKQANQRRSRPNFPGREGIHQRDNHLGLCACPAEQNRSVWFRQLLPPNVWQAEAWKAMDRKTSSEQGSLNGARAPGNPATLRPTCRARANDPFKKTRHVSPRPRREPRGRGKRAYLFVP